ncbi:phenylacetate--CoA ligase family protein [Streptomyces sp. CA2R101]|uniref:phenylacetate--CoA ligase family protein n=1 Tax=Streptomyces sp. CA2R101 TaxID=3120152 RepID=UPI00300A9F54
MYESYFAEAGERSRIPVDEVLRAHPKLSYDREREADDEAEAEYVKELLRRFAGYVRAESPEPFIWAEDGQSQISRHPIYQGSAYARAEFEELPSLSRSALRKHAEPFDYTAAETTVAYGDQTSGTSGAPLTVVYSPRFMAQSVHLTLIKVAIQAGIEGLGNRPVFGINVTDNPRLRDGVIMTDPLDLTGLRLIWHVDTGDPESLAAFTHILRDYEPEVISSKPNLYKILLDHWAETGQQAPCHPKFAVSGGAMLSDDLRARISAFFGCPAVSAYAVSETGHLGSECVRQKIHLDETLHERFELLPLLGEAEDTPEEIGELAVTSLSNACMPLVRYRLGDIARLSRDSCECGQPGPVLDELRGRTTIVFDLGEGVLLSPTRYMDLFKTNPELLEYQLTQVSSRSFRLRLELRSDVSPAEEREATCRRIRDAIAAGMPVSADIEWEECVFEQEGAKFARFRSEVTA